MAGNTSKELIDTATSLFSILSNKEQDRIIDLLKSLLSEQQSSSAVPQSIERTG